MKILVIVLYLLVGIIILRSLIMKNKKNGIVAAYSGLTFGIILYYCIIPILTMLNEQQLVQQYPNLQVFIQEKGTWKMLYPIILILIGFLVFNCTYNQSKYTNENSNIEYSSERMIKVSKIVGFALLIIGGISLIIFIGALGGVQKAFSKAEILRAFNSSLSNYVSSYIAILIIPARLVTVAPFVFFILICEENIKNKRIYIAAFIISFILSIIYFIFNAGRAPLVYFLLGFVLVFMYKFIKKPWKTILIIAIFCLPLLDIMDNISLYLQMGNWKSIEINYIKYIYQFIHPYRNIVNIIDIVNEYGLRLGKDFVTSIIGLIPGVNFPASYENTSLFFGGIDWKLKGGIPNDLITFSYIQFGFLGVPLIFGILGYIISKIDKLILKIPNVAIRNILASVMAIQIFSIIPSADFISFIRGGGFILICLTIIILASFKRRKNE